VTAGQCTPFTRNTLPCSVWSMTAADLATVATPTAADTPFVRVYLDRETGRAIIALDRDAVDALVAYLDDIGPGYDLAIDPGTYGFTDADAATAIADVIGRIAAPLRVLY